MPYVATKVLRIGDGKIAPGNPVDIENLDRGRVLRLLRLGLIVEQGDITAPAPVPNANVNKGPAGSADASDASDASADEPDDTVDEPEGWPRPTGSGWYRLSDGSSVRGEDEARDAQAVLDALDED